VGKIRQLELVFALGVFRETETSRKVEIMDSSIYNRKEEEASIYMLAR